MQTAGFWGRCCCVCRVQPTRRCGIVTCSLVQLLTGTSIGALVLPAAFSPSLSSDSFPARRLLESIFSSLQSLFFPVVGSFARPSVSDCCAARYQNRRTTPRAGSPQHIVIIATGPHPCALSAPCLLALCFKRWPSRPPTLPTPALEPSSVRPVLWTSPASKSRLPGCPITALRRTAVLLRHWPIARSTRPDPGTRNRTHATGASCFSSTSARRP